MASSPTRQRSVVAYQRCLSGKIGYATYSDALDAAERMMERGHVHPGCHITPYFCKDCGEWHVFNRVIVYVEHRKPWD